MALSTLMPRHCFGFRSDVFSNVHWIEDRHVVYPAGHNVVVMNVESKHQRFIPGTPDSEGITALAVSANKKYLAVAEKGDRGIITIFDLQTIKRRKVLTSVDSGSQEYVSMSFSPDGRLLLAQGGAPEWNLVLWIWEKSKVGSHVKVSQSSTSQLYQCLFCPSESGVVSVVGNGVVKVFKTNDNNLKAGAQPLAKREPQEYLCHAWIVDGEREKMLLGTAAGEILLVEALDLKATFYTEGGATAECIVTWSKGFMVGQGNGSVSIFDRDEKDSYRRTKVFTFAGEPQKIRCMALSMDEAQLSVTVERGKIYCLAVGNMEILKQDEDNFEKLAGMELPAENVSGMDVCIRKPLIATCSTDKAVRLWNWQDVSLELVKYFQDEAYSVAIHPSGSLLLVGFADKLRMMTVLMDDLKVYREFSIKGCREVKFSNGGHLFAAANSTLIQLYNSYTCENIGTLRGHNGKVRTLHWAPDDSKVVSGGMDGAIYEWRLSDFKREKEHVIKGCNYTCVVETPDCQTIIAAGSDLKLKEMEEQANAGTQITREIDTGDLLTQILLLQSSKIMFAGSVTGGIRTYKFPLTGEFSEMRCHSNAVTRMRLFFDESMLFTAGDDGSVFIFDVKQDVKGGAKRDVERVPFADEVMVTKSDLEERKARYTELETKYNEVLRQNQITMHIKDLETHEKIKELTEKFGLESEAERQRFDVLQQQKVEAEMEYNERLRAEEEKKQQQLNALDLQYQAKVMSEVERYQELMQEKELLNQKWDEQNSLLVESHERVIQELTEEYEAKLQEEQLNLSRQQQQKDDLQREFEEIKKQLEEDADRENEELKERYEAKLDTEKRIALNLKGDNGLMRKKFNQLQRDIDDQREELKEMFDAKKELYNTIGALEKDIAGLKKEIRGRDDTIADKEKRIYDLKKKNQELEKFKFVLDHKIKELKKQIEPREEEIADMKEQIKEMDQELERYHKTNAKLELTISDMKLKQDGLQKEVLVQRTNLGKSWTLIKRFQHDLHDVVQAIQDPKDLKEKVKDLYQRHITAPVVPSQLEEAIQREYNRQRDYLEKTVKSLKNKLDKDMQLHRTDNLRIMQENVALIKEINELRREIKTHKAAAAAAHGASAKGEGKDDFSREVEMQRDLITRLRQELENKEDRIAQLEAQVMPRPMSREKLPPMEGFKGAPEHVPRKTH